MIPDTCISALFEQDAQPMQLAALSGQEMGETEGAVAPLFWVGAMVVTRGLTYYVPRAMISQRQAINVARNGGQVFGNNYRANLEVARAAYGRNNVVFHNAHRSSPVFRDHFQPMVRHNNKSHIFMRR